MQYFGEYKLGFDKEFLTQSYLYIPKDDETIDIQEFKTLIKTKKEKKKNIIGTIMMYNPYVYPIGYDENKFLKEQNFDFSIDFIELKIEREMTLLKQAINQLDNYKGKLVEIKFLFNLNTKNIDRSEVLMSFNADCELLNTNQLTIFDKNSNYIDISNLHFNGKFIFFAWGHKINKKEFLYINDYAQAIYDKAVLEQKKISFVYRKSTRQEYAIENLQFLHPIQTGRFSSNMNNSVKKVFNQYPPQSEYFNDIN